MGVSVNCGGCGASFTVDEKHIGRKAKCGKCGSVIPIETSPPTSPRAVPSPDPVASEQPGTTISEPPSQGPGAEEPKTVTRKPRRATDKQKAFARDLGIVFDESITSREISRLIDGALAREEAINLGEVESHLKTLRGSRPLDMIEELRKQGLRAYLVSWLPAEEQDRCNIHFTDGVAEDDVYRSMVTILARVAQQRDMELFALVAEYAKQWLQQRKGRTE